MPAFLSRRTFVATALLAVACLPALTGCSRGDSGTTPHVGIGSAVSGIQGQATRGPLTPVTQSGQPNTAPLPNVVVRILTPSGAEVARQTTDSQGNYKIALSAGAYQVQGLASGGSQGLPSPPAPQTVTVAANQFITVNLDYDTGIR